MSPVGEGLSTRAALTAVLADELRSSTDTVLLGETVRGVGAQGVAAGLYEEFGPRQVIETPVSENAIVEAALGLALAGMRPIVEIYSADFLLVVANEIINDVAKWRQQHARPGGLPITIRACMGAAGGLGPEHSQSMEAYFHHAPGILIVVPGAPHDAPDLLRAAIRSGEPCLFLEHRRLYDMRLEGRAAGTHARLRETAVVRPGDDVSIVAWAWMRQEAEQAAERLALRGIDAEILDPRTIKPMDFEPIVASVRKTGRLLVVEEAPITGGIGAEILARVAEATRGAPPSMSRLAMPDAIHPYDSDMERVLIPAASEIVTAATELCA